MEVQDKTIRVYGSMLIAMIAMMTALQIPDELFIARFIVLFISGFAFGNGLRIEHF